MWPHEPSALRTQCVESAIVSPNVISRLPETAACFVTPHGLRVARALAMRTNTPSLSVGLGELEPRSSFSSNLTVNVSPVARGFFFLIELPLDDIAYAAQRGRARQRATSRRSARSFARAVGRNSAHSLTKIAVSSRRATRRAHSLPSICAMAAEFSDVAYAKLLMHVAKHPWCEVGGVLLARDTADAAAPIVVVDAVPLFHTLMLAPTFEMAMMQIEAYCKIK